MEEQTVLGEHFTTQRKQIEKALEGYVPDGHEFRKGTLKEIRAIILDNFDDAAIAALEEKCRAEVNQILLMKYLEKLRAASDEAPSNQDLIYEMSQLMIEMERSEISRYEGYFQKMKGE